MRDHSNMTDQEEREAERVEQAKADLDKINVLIANLEEAERGLRDLSFVKEETAVESMLESLGERQSELEDELSGAEQADEPREV